MRAPRRHCAYNRPFTREFRRRRRADARCRGDHRPARHPSSPGAAHDSRGLARPRDSRDLATGANDALALVPRALPAIAACACVDARACAPGRDATARRENARARVATPSFANRNVRTFKRRHRNLLESLSVSRTTPSIERATSTASRNMKPIDPPSGSRTCKSRTRARVRFDINEPRAVQRPSIGRQK